MADWRLHFETTLLKDVDPAYPGGPSHKAGARVVIASVVDTPAGPVGFEAPSPTALALSVAARAAGAAVRLREGLTLTPSPIAGDAMRSLGLGDGAAVCDYFEQCFVAAIFSVQALESYANQAIARMLPGNSTLASKRKGKAVDLTRAEVERGTSLDDKIGTVLPTLLKRQSPRGSAACERYVALRRLRDETVHLKSHHQISNERHPFGDSPFTWFVNHSATQLPIVAIDMIAYFATDHELSWVEGARQLADGLAPRRGSA